MIDKTILHYKIIEKLGEGGMGAVYKAQDTKLDRFVALKFLPSQVTATAEEKARFVQEAKAASAMNHPNVCTIYSIEEYNNQLFIAMEFIDGITLRNNKQNLSEKRILDIGVQVAEGLAAAHEKGIVHRDIKPENIMIRKDGIVQIMDFGLAKLNSSGNVSRLTKAGTTMGTMGYMSPEQVQGLDVDHRTDIFSLGVVLYEMLAGESPFKGIHETAIMYEIVNVDPPPISTIKEGIDPQLDGIILECLEKDKDERCQSAKELAKDLRKVKKSTGNRKSRVYNVNTQSFNVNTAQTTTLTKSGKTTIGDIQVRNLFKNIFYNLKLFWFVAGVFFIATVLLLVFFVFNKNVNNVKELKATVLPPKGVNYDNSIGSNLTISPNGQYISYIGKDTSGATKLWVREINALNSRELVSASEEAYPFWSPDSKYIAYFNKGKLLKISLDAGTSLPICDAPTGRGGTWSPNGTIVFAPVAAGGLYKVSSFGGNPELLIKNDPLNSNLSLRWPTFLPDGDHFLYSAQNSPSGSSPADYIFVSSLSDKKPERLISASSNAQYANGYLFFVRQSILLAQKFDISNFKISGDATPLAENLQYDDGRISGCFAVSENGELVYLEQSQNLEKTVLLDKNGNILKTLFNKRVFESAQFSPDGNKIAYSYYDPGEKNIDVWTYDINRNVSTRLTFEPAVDLFPCWSLDGKQIAYSSNPDNGVFDSYIKNSDGSGQATLLWHSQFNKFVTDFSSDGKYILYNLYNYINKNSGSDIVLLPTGIDQKPVTFLATNFNEWNATFSSNMKWITYSSDESGKLQVYIAPFRNNSGKWQISVDGGDNPKWMKNGKQVYFITPDNKIMAVDINENASSLSPGKPYAVFNAGNTNISTILDIDKTGDKILASIPNGESIKPPITLVDNWQVEVESKK